MKNCYFITLTSENRAGVLAAVTTALAELGGDMQYSTQSSVHGVFTMGVVAQFPAHRSQDVIYDHLQNVGRPYEMDVLIRAVKRDVDSRVALGQRYFLTVNGQDVPGVVRAICALLAQELISIERLNAVPHGPGRFSMVMIVNLPEAVNPSELRSELKLFAALNKLSIAFEHEMDYEGSFIPKELMPEIPG